MPMEVELAHDVQMQAARSPRLPVTGRVALQDEAAVPMVMTPQGPRPAYEQLTVGETIERNLDHEVVTRHVKTIDTDSQGRATKAELYTADL